MAQLRVRAFQKSSWKGVRLWPSDAFEIDTAMSMAEIMAALGSQTEAPEWFRFWGRHRTFQGTFSTAGFRIKRIINHGNAFLPVIQGTISSGPLGTAISIRMGLHPFVAVSMCFWFGGVALGDLAVVAGLSFGKTAWDPMLIIPFGMLLFGWLFLSGCFWPEVNAAKGVLLEILEGRERPKAGS
jgi:hypothetical protein